MSLEDRLEKYGPVPVVPTRKRREYTRIKCPSCGIDRTSEVGKSECLYCDEDSKANHYPTFPDGRGYLYGLDRVRREKEFSLHELSLASGVPLRTLRSHVQLLHRARIDIQYKYCNTLDCELEDIRNGI